MSVRPSRLNAVRGSNRIKPEFFDAIERAYCRAVPIHASAAESSNWLLNYERLHGDAFSDTKPAPVQRDPREILGVDELGGMSARERLEWVNRNPGLAAAALRGAKE